MSRITWEFFSRRRKTSLQDLVESGAVCDYSTFLAYCRELDVAPLTRDEFDAQVPSLKDVPDTAQSPSQEARTETKAEPKKEELEPEFLEATILLSGVDDGVPDEPKKKGFKRTRAR